MNYEKAYKEALEQAKGLRDSKYQTMNAKRVVEEIFPELAESEDERVRKGIIKLLDDIANGRPHTNPSAIMCNDWILWLEKQKESLHIEKTCKENSDSFTSACKDVIIAIEKYLDWLTGYPDYAPKGKYSLRDMLHCIYVLEKQKEQNPTIAGNDFGWIDELKHDLEHPEELDQKVDDVLKQRKGIRALEWSEEDEHLCNLIAKCIALGRKQGLVNDDDNIACLDLLMRKGTSWSMGDEKMLKLIISELEQEGKDVNAPELYKIEIDWLKSLRPSWKPSEEQMEALNALNCHGDLSYVGQQKQLISLYNDLKKLM